MYAVKSFKDVSVYVYIQAAWVLAKAYDLCCPTALWDSSALTRDRTCTPAERVKTDSLTAGSPGKS